MLVHGPGVLGGGRLRPKLQINSLSLVVISELPRVEVGDPHFHGERLAMRKAGVETPLNSARPVVTQWWQWAFSLAESHYQRWLKLPMLQRNQLRLQARVPPRFLGVEAWLLSKLLA